MQVRPYLIFRGECQEAIALYSQAFETQVTEVMRFSDMPASPDNPIPDNQKNWIVMASLPLGDNFMRMSDTIGALNAAQTDRIAISIECSIRQVQHAFAVLAEEGRVSQPLQQTFFSPCFGIVYDKYGVMWSCVATAEDNATA
ncbi:MAG: VOC family protein [Chloroflexi bacterium]|nr:VOC family protein [Chloroflexota bacterium]